MTTPVESKFLILGAMGLVLAASVLVGCGSAASASASPSGSDRQSVASQTPGVAGTSPSSSLTDACSYMTIDEASEALGSAIDTATPLPDAPACVYEVGGTSTLIGVEFTDEAYWNNTRSSGGYQYLNIDLGDDAYFFGDSGGLVFVVRKGSTYFSIVVVGGGRGSPRPALQVGRSAAGYVLARLP